MQKGFIQTPLLIAIIAGILVLGGGGYYGLKKYENYQTKEIEKEKQLQELLAKQQKTIDETQNEIDILKKKPAQIIKTEGAKKVDLPAIIAEWRPRMAYIECSFSTTKGEIYQVSSGSGIVTLSSDGSRAIITNKHVLLASYGNSAPIYDASSCFATFPGNNKKYNFDSENITKREDVDLGGLFFSSPDNYILNLTKNYFEQCTNNSVGDSIIILGYPSYGTGNKDITVTEGIISGYDFPYYTTSAKLEHGNSGGAAISVKNDCYIGIPTGAIAGEIESLGRILDFLKFKL